MVESAERGEVWTARQRGQRDVCFERRAQRCYDANTCLLIRTMTPISVHGRARDLGGGARDVSRRGT